MGKQNLLNAATQLATEQVATDAKQIASAIKNPSRFKEPSTWASVTGMLATLCTVFPTAVPVLAPAAALTGFIGFLLREGKNG